MRVARAGFGGNALLAVKVAEAKGAIWYDTLAARREQRSVFISMGKIEALLPANEQVLTEPYRFNDRIRVYTGSYSLFQLEGWTRPGSE